MPHLNSSKGLTVDDIHTLIHDPDKFVITLDNMTQLHILFQNLANLLNINIK